MIDLHCHILPGVDDGSPDAETSLSMARHAAESGVTAIAVTPHCNLPGFRRNYRGPDYRRQLNDLRELLTQENIPLQLYSGAEVFADPSNIRTLIEQHELITLGGSRYLLVEFDFGLPGSVLLRTLEAIAQRGLVPVVAHPERYDAVQRDPGLAAWCFSRGMLLQLNKGSLLGLLGSRAEDAALHLLSHGLAHLIASDAHDDRFRTTGFRSLLPVLEPICHPDYIALLLHGNPPRILRDEPIPIPPLQSD